MYSENVNFDEKEWAGMKGRYKNINIKHEYNKFISKRNKMENYTFHAFA